MNRPFLITGLPRSRTAWLTALANTVTDAICHHEPTAEWASWTVCFTAWKTQPHPFVGFADHALGFHLPEIVRDIAPRVLIVDRDVTGVERALARVLPGLDTRRFLDVLHDRLRAARGLPGVKVVPYAALRHFTAAMDCLTHLMPGAAIDRTKVGTMLHLNVQTDMARAVEVATERAGDIEAFLGADVVALLKETV